MPKHIKHLWDKNGGLIEVHNNTAMFVNSNASDLAEAGEKNSFAI